MIINFFKDTKPTTSISIIFVAAVCWLPVWWIPLQVIHYNNSLFDMVLHSVLSSRWVVYIGGVVFLTIQALLLNRLTNAQEIYSELNSLPALFYILFMSAFSAFWGIHPILIANFFFIPAIGKLIQINKQIHIQQKAFDASFLISTAVLIYLPLAFMLLLIPLSLILLRQSNWREYLSAFIGMILPFYIFYALAFILGDPGFFFNYFHTVGLYTFHHTDLYYLIGFGIAAFFFVFSYLDYFSNLSSKSIRVRHIYEIFLWLMIFQIICLSLTKFNYMQFPILFALPIAIIIPNVLMNQQRRKWLSEGVLILFAAYFIFVFINISNILT